MKLGTYPTPVERLDDALGPGRPLWVKRDDLTSSRYGGNKVRKLERVLDVARARGARRIVTVGGAGSHHVLATAIYAADLGIAVDAVLVPQPRTDHVAENLRAIAHRAHVWPAASYVQAGACVVDRIACGAFYVPAGGSTLEATATYADAARELSLQVTRGELPPPRTVVVALGSGGTAAGLAVGCASAFPDARVVGVTVSEPGLWVGLQARVLARACARSQSPRVDARAIHLDVDDRFLGAGFGHPTTAGASASRVAERFGLILDASYTAKTFAAALALPGSADPILYWHTLSSASMSPWLAEARLEHELPDDVRALLLPLTPRA